MAKDILILTPFHFPETGGAESFIDALEKEIIKEHRLTVLTFMPFNKDAEEYEWYQEENGPCLEIFRMKWMIKHGNAWQGIGIKNLLSVFPKMFIGAFGLCRWNRYDIIHAQGLISGLVAVLLKKIFKTKAYVTLLALYGFDKWNPCFKAMARFIFNNCDLIFVEGDNGLFDLEGLGRPYTIWKNASGDLYKNKKIKIFQHWCDQVLFKPPEKRENEIIKVLFVGRPIPEKGKKIIQDAERIIKNNRQHVNFISIDKYEFIYVENVPYEDLPRLYQMADIVCVPILYPEGYSRVVIESASCGCALITSNMGSLPEMVSGWGYFIKPTPESFATHIAAMNGNTLKQRQKDSYSFAKENFNSKNAEVFLNEYAN